MQITHLRGLQRKYNAVGCGVSLVDTKPFVRRVVGSNPALVATQGPWASRSVLHSQLPVALRREITTQYPFCVGSASE